MYPHKTVAARPAPRYGERDTALGLTAVLAQPAAAADGTPRAVTSYRYTSEAGDPERAYSATGRAPGLEVS